MAEKSALKASGAQSLIGNALLVFSVAVLLYIFVSLSLFLYIALVGLSVALGISALVELRFYELKMVIRGVESKPGEPGQPKGPA